MYDFLLQIFLVLGLGIALYILGRHLPKVEEEVSVDSPVFDHLENWLSKIPLHEFDKAVSLYWEKFLRRSKVIVMKTENLILSHLKRHKDATNEAGKSAELISQMKEVKDNSEF